MIFATFGRPTTGGLHHHRSVLRATWRPEDEFLIFDVCANALNRMVRSIVGSLKMVGSGSGRSMIFRPFWRRAMKSFGDGRPAHGLYAVSVEYDN